jgi:serine/threonine-protein kinase RsbW
VRREPHLQLTLHDGPAATADLREAVEVFSQRHGLSGEERFDLKLAATEAVTNALKGTPEPVEVTLTGEEGAVTVEVFDRGVFSPLRVTLRRGPEAESGRGIALMLALLDDVAFERSPNGTRVRLTKRRAAAHASLRLLAS